MKAYIELNMPGFNIGSFTEQESDGFGTYDLSYTLKNLYSNDNKKYHVLLDKGLAYSNVEGIDSSENLFSIWRGFESVTGRMFDEVITSQNEAALTNLEQLNLLSCVPMSIIFDRDLSMDEFYELQVQYDKLDFVWVGIRTAEQGESFSDDENIPMFLIEFNPGNQGIRFDFQVPDESLYPDFLIENDISSKYDVNPDLVPKAYEQHFRSCLEYLIDNEDFVRIFDYSSIKTKFYEKSLQYIDEKGIYTYGVRVYGTSTDLMKFINENAIMSIYINDA